jgi:hypothetical protein
MSSKIIGMDDRNATVGVGTIPFLSIITEHAALLFLRLN